VNDDDSDDDSPGGGDIARLDHIGRSTTIGIKRLPHLDTESLQAEIAASSGGILRRIATAAVAGVVSVFSPKSSRHPRALQPRAAPAPAAMNYPPAGGWREHAGMTPLFRLENTGAHTIFTASSEMGSRRYIFIFYFLFFYFFTKNKIKIIINLFDKIANYNLK